jgi:hypothetical protein
MLLLLFSASFDPIAFSVNIYPVTPEIIAETRVGLHVNGSLYLSYIKGNISQLHPQTTLICWFCHRGGECLLPGTHWIFIYCLGGRPVEQIAANATARVTKLSSEVGINLSGLRTQ